MGDRTGAIVNPEQFAEQARLGTLARLSSAGLAGKPAPGPPPSLAADGTYVVLSPGGSSRRCHRTRSEELAAFGGQEADRKGSDQEAKRARQ